MKNIILNKAGIEKVSLKNPWIYNKEIKSIPLDVKEGDLVRIYSPDIKFLAVGYANPKSKITVRILSFEDKPIDKNFFVEKINKALEKRKPLKNITNAYRLIHSEADGLSGLIVDYYDGYLSVQINTAGMERLRDLIVSTLIEELNPKGIYEKSDEKSREKEGLETTEKLIFGGIPKEIEIFEYDAKFLVNLTESQKTGFYLDQRKNRKVVYDYCQEGYKVLDLFSNSGGFGVHCGIKKADFIKFVDISSAAVNQIEKNAKINNLKNYEIVKEDVFDFLKKEVKSGFKYDFIILDPPPFAKTKNEVEGALRGFKYLILNSLKLLNENGCLAVFSCSHHITLQDLIDTTLQACKDTASVLEFKEFLMQDIDHPYIINIPNTFYLKGFLAQKI
ncbi:class I SAM-dependent rRNA methyltransferase [Sulfurihydrogenibium subterraneum]|uniref:class I SAM-dependent rRNA methyltransferase n=1 Tax=Sulfurihydrogenibium subterraneum TaxID=171121 RepID=UPI00048BA671|nr:class I SAM-dependent rRNA methyltransferase [Sulfurihydrogenibium subterraneum]